MRDPSGATCELPSRSLQGRANREQQQQKHAAEKKQGSREAFSVGSLVRGAALPARKVQPSSSFLKTRCRVYAHKPEPLAVANINHFDTRPERCGNIAVKPDAADVSALHGAKHSFAKTTGADGTAVHEMRALRSDGDLDYIFCWGALYVFFLLTGIQFHPPCPNYLVKYYLSFRS